MSKIDPKRKYLTDVNMPQIYVVSLKKLGFRAITAQEMRLDGKQDEEMIAFAKMERYIFISNDKGLMNNQRHPLSRCGGIVIVPSISSMNNVFKWVPRICHATDFGCFNGYKIQLHDDSYSKTYICTPCGGAIRTDDEPYDNCDICKRQEKKLIPKQHEELGI